MIKRVARILKLKPGKQVEYKRRHDEIWPELIENFKTLGLLSYTIWLYESENLLFLHMEIETEQSHPLSKKQQDVAERWDQFMKDIVVPVDDLHTGKEIDLSLMFLWEMSGYPA